MELPTIELHSQTESLLNTLQETSANYDGLIIVFSDKQSLVELVPSVKHHFALDATFGESVQLLLPQDAIPHQRVLIAPTGSLHNDFDDARRFKDAAYAAGIQALKVGITRPLVCFADAPTDALSHWTFDDQVSDYKHYLEVTMLGLLESTFEPVDVRQHFAKVQKPLKVMEKVGFIIEGLTEEQQNTLIKVVSAVEAGRRISKDIGNPDPEIMSPINIAKYIQEQFANDSNLKITVIEDIEEIKKEYPLAHAVTRASLAVERHHPRFVHFEYVSPDQSKVKEK
jgi:leucyl aminopeptidase